MQKLLSLKKGLITGLTMIALALFFFYGLKAPVESKYQYAIYTAYALGIVWSVWSFATTAEPSTSFKEYFSAGFKTFIIVTLLMVIYTAVFYKLNPQILELKISLNNELALKEGNHTPMEIEDNAKQMRSIFIPMMLAITTFMYLFLGALISAVTAGVIIQLKNK
ncbi:DUF4199 domain-containing protein [Ferruginibacter lapsinanis]|uniref:DUF4199 domain-containing protein n=1 Tax=Ferruginibacter lapsinanis TaxID=563172 RepID=UPI001E2F7BC1|nr:DUF4199 domain-containing protein [Ferruginibacter lapsinanis]UEG49515.1 DUF4199 domain-containing protein [Ferruginibacter lapsinanis]